MGRPKQLFLNQSIRAKTKDQQDLKPGSFWHPVLNRGICLEEVERADERQCFFYRICKVHLTYQSPKSVLDNPKTSLDCRICGVHLNCERGRKPSQYEIAAYQAMLSIGVETENWLVEVRVLKKTYSAADIWIRSANLLVMVDGEGHFDYDVHDTPVLCQRPIDESFNRAALSLGFNVLRLQFKDTPGFASYIRNAMISSGENGPPFLQYSKHFCIWGLAS